MSNVNVAEFTFDQLKSIVPAFLRWGRAIEYVSAPGRGKSTFVEDMVSDLSTPEHQGGLAIAFLGTYTPVDLLGFMVPQRTDAGVLRSTFTQPTWMTTMDGRAMSDFPWGVLFLDEFGQADPDVKKASANLLLNKQLGPWKLPPGWVVWAASNRASDRSGVTKSYDFVINRRLEVHIKDDIGSWTGWAMSHGVNPTVVAFANQNPQIVFTEGVPAMQGPWCTPRSLVMAAELLEALAGTPGVLPESDVAIQHTAGLIGAGAAAQLAAFIRLQDQLPKWADVVARPNDAKVPTKPDAQMLVCFHAAARVDKTTLDPIITYIQRLPKEFQALWAKAATRRDASLMNEKGLIRWVTANSMLLSTIMG